MSITTTADEAAELGPRRWHEQNGAVDNAIAANGIEFDQNRLRYSLGPVRDETSAADVGLVGGLVHKLSDLEPTAAGHWGAAHALDGSPAPVVGPFWWTEVADWLPDRVADPPVAVTGTDQRVLISGEVVTVTEEARR